MSRRLIATPLSLGAPLLGVLVAGALLLSASPAQAQELRRVHRLADYQPAPAVQTELLAVQKQLDEGHGTDAIAALRALLTRQDDPAARFMLANALFGAEDHEGAAREYTRILVTFPYDIAVMGNLGRALFLADRRDEARQWFARCVAEQETPELLDLLAQCHLDMGDYAAAILVLERRLALDGGNNVVRTQLARLHLMCNDAREAVRLAQEGLEQESLDAELLRILANAHLREGVLDQARIVLEVLEITEQATAADRRMLADLHLHGGASFEAARLYRTLVAGGEPELEDRRRLAIALWKSGEREAARDELRELVQDSPEDAVLLLFFGRVLVVLAAYEEALDPLQRAIVLDPRNAEALLLRAEACLRLGRLDEAELAFREAAPLEGAGARSLAGRGEVALARGETEEALELYRQAQALDPADNRIYDRLLVLRKRYR
ncbi:MAG: tetratricopeptide repeat protein [Planctomycetota bacterium]